MNETRILSRAELVDEISLLNQEVEFLSRKLLKTQEAFDKLCNSLNFGNTNVTISILRRDSD